MAMQQFDTSDPCAKAKPDYNDPEIRFSNIQGDILIGLQKDAEAFVFFNIVNSVAFKTALRENLTPLITSTQLVREREEHIAAIKAAKIKTRLMLLGCNIGFTHRGLQRLLEGTAVNIDTIPLDESFVAGAHRRANHLQDDTTNWPEHFREGDVDGVLLITGPCANAVQMHVQLVQDLLGASVTIVGGAQSGAVRPQRGHEHFGFLDGVSQPGIRGLTLRENPLNGNQGIPGQDLLWPGEFVFSYPAQDLGNQQTPGPVKDPPADWMADGSYMVWRRLEQRVPEFHEEVDTQAKLLGMDPSLLAARMVGRWPSGAPVIVSASQDDPLLGSDRLKNNDFEFGGDAEQRRCPYAAHIRKTYPRDDLGDAAEAFVQTKRLRRAGIPFGPEVNEQEETNQTTTQSRGLMFVCYQTSIAGQFEFVQND